MAPSDAAGGHPVAAGILVRHGSVLLCLRSTKREWYPGVWDLPGGHIEEGERPSAALVREIREELAIEATEPNEDCHFRVVTSDFDMQVWVVTDWAGSPLNASPDEHDDLGWFSVSEAADLHLADECYLSLIRDALTHTSRRSNR